MTISNVILGALFILFALIAIACPNSVTGSQSCSKRERYKLSRFVFCVLFCVGLIIIISDILFTLIHKSFFNYILHPILYVIIFILFALRGKGKK